MENLVRIKITTRTILTYPSKLTGVPGWYLQTSDVPKVKSTPQALRVHRGISQMR